MGGAVGVRMYSRAAHHPVPLCGLLSGLLRCMLAPQIGVAADVANGLGGFRTTSSDPRSIEHSHSKEERVMNLNGSNLFSTALTTPALLAALAGAASAPMALGQVTPNAGMMRWPDVSADKVCFVYANDIWVAPKSGGVASPLASPPGLEMFPRFSPDGKTIAFNGNYDGNRDVYSVNVQGGVPERVTYHPAGETLADWTPDGGLLFMANGIAGLPRQSQLFTVGAAGGLPEKLPVPYAGFGSISPDGKWLAYTPHSTDTRTWKRYRGGMATDIWLFNLNDKSSRQVTEWEGTDTQPMWVPGGNGDKVYYLSDNGPEHRLNIWSFNVASGARTQVTKFATDDVRWPSVGPGSDGKGEIIFQLGSKIMLLNLGTSQSNEISITIPGARPKVRERTVDAAGYVNSAAISPSGKRVAIEARGDLWSAPAKEGPVRNTTRTNGIAERDPAWSPDGRWIAYFSDETGENELWVRASDAKAPEKKDEKKDDKKGDTKEGAEGDAAAAEEVKADVATPAPRKLTSLGAGYRFSPTWSPDSKHIAFTDQNGRIYVTNVASGETKEFDKDPLMNQVPISWSGDSRWIAYTTSDMGNQNGVVHIGNIATGEKKAVTSPMFNSQWPTFDRKGEFLFFRSQRALNNPTYADIDTTFVYTGTDTLLMVPLRADVKNPRLPKSDEETYKEEKKDSAEGKKDDKKGDKQGDGAEKKDGESKDDPKPKDAKEDAAVVDDGVSGTWSGRAKFNNPPEGMPPEVPFTLKLVLKGTDVSGTISAVMGSGSVSGSFNKETNEITFTSKMGQAQPTMVGKISGEDVSGTWTAGDSTGTWSAKRTAKADPKDADGKDESDSKSADEVKEVKIDFDGFERRAMPIPVSPGSFGALAVADGEKLIFVRQSARGSSDPTAIKVYEYNSDEPEEKNVTNGGNFQLTADGKKLLVFRGGSGLTIVDASSGGGKSQNVPTGGMTVRIDPRTEWNQIFNDAWRITRDYFYEPTLHGVDWKGIGEHYRGMIADATTRDDVNWIIAEMISELNIGHAYLGGLGDVESAPNVNMGMLGCDYELVKDGAASAYKIAKIYEGAAWDSDARGPLSQPGVDIKVGDFLIAVDGVAIDTTKAPWAAFTGTAGRTVTLTVSDKATGGKERHVLVKPVGNEADLRYRAWIERNRAIVDEKSGGQIGYIYVPNTGVDGQSDLIRQFVGQRGKAALLIDERWNGGGQIPTRFIELLNRPVTNYWAKRDGQDWTWPPDSHQGPKAMLVNGLAGSGGDMFPWLFKHNKIGKVFGTRTWGGLVGISGNPGFIDGGSITVPTFGFYETDGTWGVEGHGVDPDVVVIDDPAKMWNGGDPQLDAAIDHLKSEIARNPYKTPKRPASPDRSKMGLRPEDQ